MELGIAIAVSLMLGLGAVGATIGMGILGESSWRALLANQSYSET